MFIFFPTKCMSPHTQQSWSQVSSWKTVVCGRGKAAGRGSTPCCWILFLRYLHSDLFMDWKTTKEYKFSRVVCFNQANTQKKKKKRSLDHLNVRNSWGHSKPNIYLQELKILDQQDSSGGKGTWHQAWWPEFNSWNADGGRRKLTTTSCLWTPIYIHKYHLPHPHTYVHNQLNFSLS